MKKGDVILNRAMSTQLGKITAKKGHRLMSVFLGSVPSDMEPDPEKRLYDLGYRQMAMFETAVRISIDHSEARTEDFEWRLVFSELGAVDAVESAVRFAHKMIADELDRGEPGTPAPYLSSIYVGTIQIGPIAEDGTPHNGRGPAFFGWQLQEGGITLDQHLETLRAEARRHSR